MQVNATTFFLLNERPVGFKGTGYWFKTNDLFL